MKRIIITIFVLFLSTGIYASSYDVVNSVLIMQKANMSDAFRPTLYIGKAKHDGCATFSLGYSIINQLDEDYKGEELDNTSFTISGAPPIYKRLHFNIAGTYSFIGGDVVDKNNSSDNYSLSGFLNWAQWSMGFDIIKTDNSALALYCGLNLLTAIFKVHDAAPDSLSFGYCYGLSYTYFWDNFQISIYWMFSDTFGKIQIDDGYVKKDAQLPIGGPGFKIDYLLTERLTIGVGVSGLLFSLSDAYCNTFYDGFNATTFYVYLTHVPSFE